MFEAWHNTSGDPSTAKFFGNVIHAPMLSALPNTLVIDLVPPPELHLMLGGVNTMYSGESVTKDNVELLYLKLLNAYHEMTN